jgi:hypothetical protein
LLPYYLDLNPTELIWASVKEYVFRKNVGFHLDDAITLAEKQCNIITKEEGGSRSNNDRLCKQNYLWLESTTDNISEQIVLNLQNDSDNSSCSSSKEKEEEEVEDDGDLSGI